MFDIWIELGYIWKSIPVYYTFITEIKVFENILLVRVSNSKDIHI